MTLTPLAELREAAELARRQSDPFVCLVSARGHADLGRRSLMGRGLALEWSAPTDLSDPSKTIDALRRAARTAFARGAQGLLVLVTHEGGACFDRIDGHDDWLGLPRIQLWSVERVQRAMGGEAGGRWGEPSATPQIASRDELASSVRRAWHRESVMKVHDAIASGRLYQLCLTFPVALEPPRDSASLFAWLMSRHPVDHAAWVSLPDFELLSASPERFLSINRRTATLRPMKGTRRLDPKTPERHEQALRELATSIKDRAENVMITDLARNDLGRVCLAGSVQVDSLFEIERYASVAQMTSTVRGTLREGLDVWDALAAAFPPGSMTGAPKIESCRMIRELEIGPRGLYGGVLGWIEPNGDAEFSVVIRSLQSRGDEARWDIGGGIVHDSEAEAEWDEAWAKFEAIRPLVVR